MPKITTDELKKIKQRLCPHHYIKQEFNIFDWGCHWECSDCSKFFSITDVINIANLRLKEIKGNYRSRLNGVV